MFGRGGAHSDLKPAMVFGPGGAHADLELAEEEVGRRRRQVESLETFSLQMEKNERFPNSRMTRPHPKKVPVTEQSFTPLFGLDRELERSIEKQVGR